MLQIESSDAKYSGSIYSKALIIIIISFHVVCTVNKSTHCLKPHGLKRTYLTNYIQSPMPTSANRYIDDDDDDDDDNDTHDEDSDTVHNSF